MIPADQPFGNPDLLRELMHYPMPFGKYQGQLIRALPMAYLEWFAQKGFPAGKLGVLLQTMYEIRLNGLEFLLDGLTPKPTKAPALGRRPKH